MSSDNTTHATAAEYDARIGGTIPFYGTFHSETLAWVRAVKPEPAWWLDTGAGTGTLIERACAAFPRTRFLLADPSEGMLAAARSKLACQPVGRVEFLQPCGSEELEPGARIPEVVTAIQAHHYLSVDGRRRALRRCYEVLAPEGVLVTFENIRPLTQAGTRWGLARWRAFQEEQGKPPDQVAAHLSRFDREYHPITVLEHLDLLREVGFSSVELIWSSVMQAGFIAGKDGL